MVVALAAGDAAIRPAIPITAAAAAVNTGFIFLYLVMVLPFNALLYL